MKNADKWLEQVSDNVNLHDNQQYQKALSGITEEYSLFEYYVNKIN